MEADLQINVPTLFKKKKFNFMGFLHDVGRIWAWRPR